MSDNPNRGCAYTPVYSPGYAHDPLEKHGSTYVNDFECNHALDVYQLTLSIYKILFNGYLMEEALYFSDYHETDPKKI